MQKVVLKKKKKNNNMRSAALLSINFSWYGSFLITHSIQVKKIQHPIQIKKYNSTLFFIFLSSKSSRCIVSK
jgi:hypothetical protein